MGLFVELVPRDKLLEIISNTGDTKLIIIGEVTPIPQLHALMSQASASVGSEKDLSRVIQEPSVSKTTKTLR